MEKESAANWIGVIGDSAPEITPLATTTSGG
jgi:hypothetical protein